MTIDGCRFYFGRRISHAKMAVARQNQHSTILAPNSQQTAETILFSKVMDKKLYGLVRRHSAKEVRADGDDCGSG